METTRTPLAARRPAARRVLRRAAPVLAGLVLAVLTIFLLLEAGLRAVSYYGERQRVRAGRVRPGVPVLLCEGDSWTFGAESGAPSELGYPARLQALVDREAGPGTWQVINRGDPGQDSPQLVGALYRDLIKYRPRVVVVLVGALNWFIAAPDPGASGPAPADDDQDRDSQEDDPYPPPPTWAGADLPGRLKVVQVLRMALQRRRFQPLPPSSSQVLAIQKGLRIAIQGPSPAGGPPPGVPELSLDGCGDPAAAREALTAATPSSLEDLVARSPACAAARVLAAERCLAAGDAACAQRQAAAALSARADDPRARVVLARLGLASGRVHEALDLVEPVRRLHPAFLEAQRLWVLGNVSLQDFDLCGMSAELAMALRRSPGLSWAAAGLEVVRRGLASDEGAVVLDARDRRLWQDLTAVRSLCAQHGASLLLLNYPLLGLSPCRARVVTLVARFARQNGVPLVDLGQIFDRPGAQQSLFGLHHPNAAGYRALASQVLVRLKELGWLSRGEKN